MKNLCCGLCLIKIHSEVGLTSVSNLLEFIETHFCSNESSSNRILMNDTNAMTLQIVFHNRETKTKLSRVRTTCHHYCLNAFHCVEVWPTKSSFIHADILWSPFSLSHGLWKHKPKINYSNDKSKRKLWENFYENPLSLQLSLPFLIAYNSSIIFPFCLFNNGRDLRHCHRSPHTPKHRNH